MKLDRFFIDIYRDGDFAGKPVVYAYMEHGSPDEVWEKGGPEHAYVLAAVNGSRWNDDLSPWEAPRAFKKGGDFGGNGAEFLKALTEQIVSAVERELGYTPEKRIIGGYSMAGLFAVYAVYHTDLFSGCASASGSLWFDRFAQYCMEHRPSDALRAVYLSLGDGESRTRNERLARVASCTDQICQRFQNLHIPARFEMNPGTHFDNPSGRTARAFDCIVKMLG